MTSPKVIFFPIFFCHIEPTCQKICFYDQNLADVICEQSPSSGSWKLTTASWHSNSETGLIFELKSSRHLNISDSLSLISHNPEQDKSNQNVDLVCQHKTKL